MQIRNDTLDELEKEYISALQDYLEEGGEIALERAYEVGRKAIADGRGILDIAAVHRGALVTILPHALTPEERGEAVKKASQFFDESIAPFEMTFRGFHESIANLHNLNKTLEQSEMKFRSVVRAANDAIISSEYNGKIISWNKRAEIVFGYAEEEVLGKPLTILMPERFRYIHSRKLERLRLSGDSEYDGKTHEFYGLRKDGSEFPIEISIATWETEEGTFFTGIVRDITDRKRTEEELQRAHDELELRVDERTSQLVAANESLQAEITERKRTEEALRNSEERHRLLAETMMQGVVHQDAEGKIISMNPAAERILGKSQAEFLGETSVSVEHHTVREDGSPFPGLEHPAMMALQTGQKLQDVVMGVYNPREKGYRWININAVPLFRAGEDRPHQVYTVFEDITERKRAEQALRKANDELELRVQKRTTELEESEKKYRLLVDNALVGVFKTNLRGEILYANDALAKMHEFESPEEFRRDNALVKYKNPADRKFIIETLKKKGTIEGFETEMLTKTKKTRNILLSAAFESDMISGMMMDITERKRAEKLLKEQADILRKEIIARRRAEDKIAERAALLDITHDAIAVRDLEHRLIYWNKGAEEMYGWTEEEAIGKNANELLYTEESPELMEAKKMVIEKGEWSGELRQVTKEGKDIIVDSRWALTYDRKVAPKSILIINTDITEKKKLEAQFLRAQRMDSIGTLAGGMAHDLNNMLTPITLSLQILREEFPDADNRKLVDIIEKNTMRGADLIKQVLSFARGIEGERRPVQVAQLISEIEKVADATFPKSIKVRSSISGGLWEVNGDATQLQQVLMNMCVNSRDAMPEGGILGISAENLFIDENYARTNIEAKVGPHIAITVSDTGIGIPPELLDKVFEPFFTTKAQGKGTGLGLSTSLGIVKSHSGFIEVNSEVGKGTSFKVYLPSAATTGMQKIEAQELTPQAGDGEVILVVDDEAPIREVTGAILETNGYKVMKARDGAEAITLYQKNGTKIKVVLVDMAMPVMDGQACIQALRKINPEIKIIAVSGLMEKDSFSKVAKQVNTFLNKPYKAEELLKTIQEVCGKGE